MRRAGWCCLCHSKQKQKTKNKKKQKNQKRNIKLKTVWDKDRTRAHAFPYLHMTSQVTLTYCCICRDNLIILIDHAFDCPSRKIHLSRARSLQGFSYASVSKPEIENAILQRAAARKNKDFKSADEIRNRLLSERGTELRDLPDGRTTWRVKL